MIDYMHYGVYLQSIVGEKILKPYVNLLTHL